MTPDPLSCDAGALCRLDERIVAAVLDPARQGRLIRRACLAVILGGACYGLVFGLWHSPRQALYAAAKFPLLLLSVVAVSSLINTMLAQVLGARVSLRLTCLAMLLGMAAAALVLAALAPVAAFFVQQAPPPGPGIVGLPSRDPAVAPSMRTFHALLLLHVFLIGVAGLIGNLRLYRVLRAAIAQRDLARRVMLAWIAVCGFAGCEMAWLFSPFLCKPNYPPHVLAREYFQGNFYEHVYRALADLLAH